jgi:pimeloyl-ACP methyl ester carboxylesterase
MFDLPGTGYSGPDPSARTVASTSDVVAGLIEALGIKTPTLLGWGLGGEVALAVVERHPAVASHLVLVDSSAGGPKAKRPSPAIAAAFASPSTTNFQLSAVLFPLGAVAARTGWLSRTARLPSDDLVASAVRAEATMQENAWSSSSLALGLPRITIPTYIVYGSDDQVFPPADDLVLIDAIPHARALVLPGAAYGSTSQDAMPFVAGLETFTTK